MQGRLQHLGVGPAREGDARRLSAYPAVARQLLWPLDGRVLRQVGRRGMQAGLHRAHALHHQLRLLGAKTAHRDVGLARQQVLHAVGDGQLDAQAGVRVLSTAAASRDFFFMAIFFFILLSPFLY